MRKYLVLIALPAAFAVAGDPQSVSTSAPLEAAASTGSARVLVSKGKSLLIDDFEMKGATNAIGGEWTTGFDRNNLGTTLSPVPFAVSRGGSPISRKFCAKITGRLGKNVAPWAWADLTTTLAADGGPMDISDFSGIQFYARGDGREYQVIVHKRSVQDSAHYGAKFKAGGDWRLVKVPFDSMAQPTWTKQPAPSFWNDVTEISFVPTKYEANFELSIDDVALYK